MATPYFAADTLDDVMRLVFQAILERGGRIAPSRGPATELTGTLIELLNPRARLSRTETRGKPFSCLGELTWYLAGSSSPKFISYYIPHYKSAEGDEIYGAYGPRFRSWKDLNQIDNVIQLLKRKRDSRQAVVQLFDATDLIGMHEEVPCTCTLQFMVRRDRLELFVNMRSNDAYWGMPHDIFSFTMLQELVAASLSVELGTYKHAVGSLHLYDDKLDDARQYLAEGWQPTTDPMPQMPTAEPWSAVEILLQSERALREGTPLNIEDLKDLDPYWSDLVRLLRVFRAAKDKDRPTMEEQRDAMTTAVYKPFIEQRIRELS